jgi:hypothetical protein
MATFVVCHGAWSGGWSWKKLRRPLAERGHVLWTPTYTGLGELSHLSSPVIDLDTHIADILGILEYEDAGRVLEQSGWRYFELASGHIPNVTRPMELADLFDRIAESAN